MSFLSPALFAALVPLALLPLVLHLLNKGFPRHFRFPSIELIRRTLAQRSRLHRWRHWILLLLRTAFLLLLLLAFLRPVLRRFGPDPAARGGRRVLIVFDHSLSMEDRGDGPASRERGIHEANQLLDSLGPKDQVNILLMQPHPASCFVSWSGDIAGARHFLEQLPPGLGGADVNQANAQAASLLGPQGAGPEIYYISDFTRKKWSDASFQALPADARLFFVDVGPARRDNRAVLNARPSQTEILAGDTVPLEVTLGNFAAAPFDGRVTVAIDRKFSFDQAVSMAPWSEEKFTVPVPVGGPGVHFCEVWLPADALEYDNRFVLTLSVLDKEEVPVVTDAREDSRSGAFYLKTALNPFEKEAGSLLPSVIPSSELSAARLAGVQKVFLTRVNHLNADATDALARMIFRGGGAVYFLDGTADAENLALLESRMGAGTMPLRIARRIQATNVTSGAQQIVRGDFRSRYLKLFAGDVRQDLGLLEVYDYYQAGATGAGSVLLQYGDGSPAMAVANHGLGTLLLLNFSAAEFSSNLARQRLFPAWMQDLVKALASTEPPPVSTTVGEALHTEIWRSEAQLDLRDPAGTVVATQRELNGERCALSFTPDQPGFYTLGAPRPARGFAVNPATGQSDLRLMDKDLLPAEFSDHREAHLVAGADAYDELAHGRPVYQWFILGAIACLLLESGFQVLVRRRTA